MSIALIGFLLIFNAFLIGDAIPFLTFGLVSLGGFCFYLEFKPKVIEEEIEK